MLAERPEWLSVMIGINDVWRSFDSAGISAVPLAEYTSTLGRLLGAGARRDRCTADFDGAIHDSAYRTRLMRSQMDQYGASVRDVATEFGAVLVRTQGAFDTALATTVPQQCAGDQIIRMGQAMR